ncbi:uncharacterized protein [Oryza sativa Japonica Group]|nr:uncharacterized protein LOC4328483 isoform X1 [Oryza sativa Japonica Group]XP_015624750.1 uncharacterized protein LOC4328483 isoform X1 [Oryza sativa Japonica Group]KAF2943387.1 hypothetical protein DAI22_02g060700 [Oryza sativa Japonica Group]KAF2943391.1 hypothetical protein DAI22_02g060700 [Oryza sativa Japonica Group]KAF2943398.1 hypothetical protein DAI22_02g060700 [Oryza sativa Japonica Group]
MATAAAGDDPPSPPPPAERPGGWFSGLVCGAGRLLAAVLGPDSPDSGTGGSASSSQESSSQSPPPPRGHRGSGDNTAHFASNNQFNQSGKEITLKDSGVGSLALVSEIDPKDAILQMLLQETYSRSECDILIKIIHERVVDSDPDVVEPSIVLPIAWQTSQQQDHVPYSSFRPNTCSASSNVHDCSQQLDNNIVENGWLEESQHALKRSNSCTGHNLDESHSRSVRPKLNDLNISNRQDGILKSHSDIASFEEATTKYPNAFRGIPEDTKKLFKDIPLLGTDNLIFSNIVSYDDTDNDISALRGKRPAVTARTFASATSEANRDNRCPTMLYPYSDRDLTNTFPIKVEPLDDIVPFDPEIVVLSRKNRNTGTICNDPCSVSKLMFQEDKEAAPSSSTGVPLENSPRNCTGASLQRSTQTRRSSPANVYRRQYIDSRTRSRSGPSHQGEPIAVGQEPDLAPTQAKKPVGRPRKSRRYWKASRR